MAYSSTLDIKAELNSKQAQDALALLRGFLSPNATLRGASEILVERIKSRFLKHIDPYGRKWKESLSGIARRETMGAPYGTLYRTGELYKGIRAWYSGEFEWDVGISKTSPASRYGYLHNDGAPDRGIPARPFLGFNSVDVDLVEEYLNSRLEQFISGMKL